MNMGGRVGMRKNKPVTVQYLETGCDELLKGLRVKPFSAKLLIHK